MTFFLVAVGVIMVYSSSSILAMHKFQDPLVYVRQQAIRALAGFGLMGVFYYIPRQTLQKFSFWALFVCILMLILVLIPGIGIEVSGGRRWLFVGTRIQPSELFKVFYTIFLGFSLGNLSRIAESEHWKRILFHFCLLSFAFTLIQLQPDFSTAFLIFFNGMLLLFTAYFRPRLIAIIVIAGSLIAGWQIYEKPYRLKRIEAFLNPEGNAMHSGYQVVQSWISIGSGGIIGLGLGQSRQKFLYLPEEHTDFIFSIISEEFGLLGGLVVLLAFLIFLWRCLVLTLSSPDPGSRFVILGISLLILVQALINLFVVVGMIPPTGIPLPFISYGGSSLVTNLVAVGVILNLSRECRLS